MAASSSVVSPWTAPDTPVRQVLKMAIGYQVSAVVSAVAQLTIPDLLVGGAKSAADLAEAVDAHPDTVLRLMRVAVSLGLFEQVGADTFAINPLSQCLRSDTHSVRGVALASGRIAHVRPVEHMVTAIRENRSVVKDTLGMEIWEYWDQDPETKAAMTEHLVEVNAATGPAIQQHFDLSRFRRIVDIGGNEGFFLSYLLQGAPQATGVLFDRPEVMDEARATMTAKGLADRVEFVGGDFMDQVPPGGDLYVLKGILHDSNNQVAAQILANCETAGAPGSTLILVEGMMPDQPPYDPIVQLVDINMLLMVDGRERNLGEFSALLDAAGYDVIGATPLPETGYFPFHVIEARHR